ncbi:hypothetical protein F383_26697 [Gossypium arboreum]|uniref:Uncharacterized protein n=1 Tax=Gossypium arboreum TaxID=29729 RepID=A0A0B0P4Y9_GOSAR|nr:hypothetical protein F383_26697 [Gossypium arboreum]
MYRLALELVYFECVYIY